MRIYIRHHMIHLGTGILISVVHEKRVESFGASPALLKREIPKKNVATASEEKNPLFGFAPGANKKTPGANERTLSYRPASVTEYRLHTVLLRSSKPPSIP